MEMKLKHLSVHVLALTCVIGLSTVSAFAAEDDHKGHDHASESKEKKGGHGHEGNWDDLGTTTSGKLQVTAKQLGKVEAGKEGIFEIELGEGAKPPKAVRIWVGIASGEGSTKTKADKSGDGYEGHTEVPKTLPGGSALWVEIEPAEGNKAKVSFPIKK